MIEPHDRWAMEGDVDPYASRDIDFDVPDTIPCPADWECDPDD